MRPPLTLSGGCGFANPCHPASLYCTGWQSHVVDLWRAVVALAERVNYDGHLIVTDFHPYNLLVGMRVSYCQNEVKFYVPYSIHLPSEYVGLAEENGFKLEASAKVEASRAIRECRQPLCWSSVDTEHNRSIAPLSYRPFQSAHLHNCTLIKEIGQIKLCDF